MKNTSKKIIFFGTDQFSLTPLKKLFENGYTIEAIVTKPDSHRGRGHKLNQSVVKKFAIENNITVLQPEKLSDIKDFFQNMDSRIGVLASFGKIIPGSIIDIFELGIINIHPSLLPKYRGPSPIETAILNGDPETGVSIMQLTAQMDAGPIYKQTKYTLNGTETKDQLFEVLAGLGSDNLLDVLPSIIDGSFQSTEQDNSLATYCKLIQKEDGLIKPGLFTADEIERQIRAYSNFPKSKYSLDKNTIVIITEAHVALIENTNIDIECKDGNYLIIDRLTAPSGRSMSAKEFVNGYTPAGD